MPHGSVTEFDEARGLGVISDDADHEFRFHCIEIVDGTRWIAVGTPVRFEVMTKLGHYEAVRIESWTTASDESST
jgi:cold shock CspA family protein